MEIMRDLLVFEPQRDSFMRPVSTDDMNDLSKDVLQDYKDKGSTELKDLAEVDRYHESTTLPYQLRAAEAFWKGKALVGIIALASTHHVKAQIAGLELNLQDEEGKPKRYRSQDKRLLKYKMNFEGFDPEASTVDLRREWDIEKNRKVSDIISQGVNASVDVVNNPILHILNLSPDNAGAWLMLVRAGVPLKSIVYFFNQPIIKDYMKAKEKNNSRVFRGVKESTLPEKVLTGILDKYRTSRASAPTMFTATELKKMMAKTPEQMRTEENGDIQLQKQLQILDDFLVYTDMGEKLGNAVNAQSFDTKLPKNRHHLRVIQRKYQNVLDEGTFENVKEITEGSTFMREMTAYNMNMDGMFRDLFLTEQAGEAYNEAYNVIVDKYTDPKLRMSNEDIAKVLNTFEEEFISYVLQTMSNAEGITMGNKIQSLMFGDNSMAMQLAKIQRDPNHPLHENIFIQSLVPVPSTKRSGADKVNDYITPVSRTMTTFEYNSIYDGFREIEYTHPELAKDLMKAAFFQSGVGQSPHSFLETIPGSSFMRLGEDILDKFLKNPTDIDISKFYDPKNPSESLFFRNQSVVEKSVIAPKSTRTVKSILPASFGFDAGVKSYKANINLDSEGLTAKSVLQIPLSIKGTSTLKDYMQYDAIARNVSKVNNPITFVEGETDTNEQDLC